MDLLTYYKQVQTVNFHYQDIKNAHEWNVQRLYYEKCLKNSWCSRDHRKVWLKVKQHKLVDKN